MAKMKKLVVVRTTRSDQILLLTQKYSGKLNTPKKYNKAFANVIREMADAIEKLDDSWVDPELVVWMHQEGVITAEVPLSDKV